VIKANGVSGVAESMKAHVSISPSQLPRVEIQCHKQNKKDE
jgi:hypothetical protein